DHFPVDAIGYMLLLFSSKIGWKWNHSNHLQCYFLHRARTSSRIGCYIITSSLAHQPVMDKSKIGLVCIKLQANKKVWKNDTRGRSIIDCSLTDYSGRI